jgi:formamidopyrimidine-DNA glycosylase
LIKRIEEGCKHMPEYPEIANLTHQLKERLVQRVITAVEVLQPKCLNMDPENFTANLSGAAILSASQHGKWILIETSLGWLLINLGMGGEVLIVPSDHLPEKRRVVFYLDDHTCLSINFWWFGYTHFVKEIQAHPMVSKLGPNALDLSKEEFHSVVKNQRGGVKAFLLDQEKISGIGNAYIHDILFLAKLHPLRKVDNLSTAEIDGLFEGIQNGLLPSLKLGGGFYEKDTYGNPGGFPFDKVLVGYREGQPCPSCNTLIVKIKTGSTASYICPTCQK